MFVVFPFLSPSSQSPFPEMFYRVDGLSLSFYPDHAEKLHELPDEYLADALPIAKKIAIAQGAENYNLLQVRGCAFPPLYLVLIAFSLTGFSVDGL